MIVYLQVAQLSQALIFITRSIGFWFMERKYTSSHRVLRCKGADITQGRALSSSSLSLLRSSCLRSSRHSGTVRVFWILVLCRHQVLIDVSCHRGLQRS